MGGTVPRACAKPVVSGSGGSRGVPLDSDGREMARVSVLPYGDIPTDAAFVTARHVRLNASPSSAFHETVRSPERSTPGTRAAWSARA